MIRPMILCLAGIALLNASASAQDDATPVKDFLLAADAGDMEAMVAAMDPKRGISSKKLLREIRDCYLYRARGGPSGQMVAIWMCARGEDKSVSIFADVSKSGDGAVVELAGERKHDYPAPARTGPAITVAGS